MDRGILEELTVRDLFAMHAPEPSEGEVNRIREMEHQGNPNNEPDGNKTRIRDAREIRAALRWKWADDMMKLRDLKDPARVRKIIESN